MPCGAVSPDGVVCDNSGTSAHAGLHEGPRSIWGFTTRVRWKSGDVTPAIYKRPDKGVTARSSVGIITTGGGAASLAATGMNLGTRYQMTSGSWVRMPGWVPRSGFSGVEIENNALRIAGSGNVRVFAAFDITVSGFAYTVSKRIVKNGTVLQTWTDAETLHSVDTTVADGDQVWSEISYSGYVTSCYVEANANSTIYTQVL